jgi:hypothetical protein
VNYSVLVDAAVNIVCLVGMFLFAKLVMNNLFNQTTRRQLYNELLPEKFPRGLNKA